MGPALPSLADQVGWQVGKMGFLFSARSLGYLLGALVIGRWFDRLAGHNLLGGSLLCLAICTAIIPNSPKISLLILVLFVSGLSQGGIDVGTNTLLTWTFRQRVAPYLNGLFFFGGIGSFAIPLIIHWSLGRYNTLGPAFWMLAGLMLPVAVGLFSQPSPPLNHQKAEEHSSPINTGLVIGFATLIFAYIGLEVSFGGWIYTYLVKQGVALASQAATLTSLFWLAITIGRLVAIPLSKRLSAQSLISANLAGVGLSLLSFLFFPNLKTAAWVGTIGTGFFLASLFPTTFSLAGRSFTISGKLAGRIWASGSAGAIVMPWLAGQTLEWYSPSAMIILLLIMIIAASLVFGILIRKL